MVIGSGVWGGVKSLIAGVLFSHAFSGELKAVSVHGGDKLGHRSAVILTVRAE